MSKGKSKKETTDLTYPDVSPQAWMGFDQPLHFEQLDFDRNRQHGQVRELDEEKLKQREQDIQNNFPKYAIRVLVVPKDETRVSLLWGAPRSPPPAPVQCRRTGSSTAPTPPWRC